MYTDRKAFFEKMVSDYGRRLYNLIRSIVLNHEDANDLLQETLIKAWRGLPRFRHQASLGTWLYRIALNEALHHQKKLMTRQKLRFQKKSSMQTEDFVAEDPETALTAALSSLTVRQRSIFAMHYFDHMSFAEIALMLNISEATAKVTYHQASNKIKKFIQGYAEH